MLVNVTKPLKRGSKVNFNGATSYVIFCYEKLGEFCFIYGKQDYVDRDCPTLYASEI